MMECRSCRRRFKKATKSRTDSLVLCDSCFDDVKAKIERISEEFRNLSQKSQSDESVCSDCHGPVEYNDVMTGDGLCDNCRKSQADASYLLSSSSGKELKKRLDEILRRRKDLK